MKNWIKFTLIIVCIFLHTNSLLAIKLLNTKNNHLLNKTGTDYTFCLNDISVTFYSGGNAEMIRYGLNKKIVKKVTGTWTAYGSENDMPGQTVKVTYSSNSSEEFSYILIRDGNGNPSVLVDAQGRRYNLCKTSGSSAANDKYFGFSGPEKTVGETIVINNLEIKTTDIAQIDIGWEDAIQLCKNLGDDWRLPTINELKIIYSNRKKCQAYEDRVYWSSTKTYIKETNWGKVENIDAVYTLDMKTGEINAEKLIYRAGLLGGNDYLNKRYTKAVRNYKPVEPKVSEIKPLKNDIPKLDSAYNKYLGTYISEQPSISSVEIFANNNILKMKVIRPNLTTEYWCVLKRDNNLYFTSDIEWDGSSYKYYLDISNLKDIVLINPRDQKFHLTKK